MKYDDKIIFSEEMQDDTAMVIKRLEELFPEYKVPGAVVTPEFIKILNVLMDDDFEINDLDPDLLSEEEVRDVIERMPSELLSKPLHPDTINAISDNLFSVMNNWALEFSLSSECNDADSFSLRASAKQDLGLHDYALADHDKVCELEPDNPWNFISRACCLTFLGRHPEALEDAFHAFEIISNNPIESAEKLQNLLHLSFCFEECRSPKMITLCLIKYVALFQALLPYANFDKTGNFSIEKNGESYDSDLCMFEVIFQMIHDMEKREDNNQEISSLLEKLKTEIGIFRALVKF